MPRLALGHELYVRSLRVRVRLARARLARARRVRASIVMAEQLSTAARRVAASRCLERHGRARLRSVDLGIESSLGHIHVM